MRIPQQNEWEKAADLAMQLPQRRPLKERAVLVVLRMSRLLRLKVDRDMDRTTGQATDKTCCFEPTGLLSGVLSLTVIRLSTCLRIEVT